MPKANYEVEGFPYNLLGPWPLSIQLILHETLIIVCAVSMMHAVHDPFP